MLKIKVEFNSNQGSFALDAIAQTIGGDWSEKSSTDTSGIITNVDADAEQWVKEVLEEDDNVVSYTISAQ